VTAGGLRDLPPHLGCRDCKRPRKGPFRPERGFSTSTSHQYFMSRPLFKPFQELRLERECVQIDLGHPSWTP
jgi:hypothetical protein